MACVVEKGSFDPPKSKERHFCFCFEMQGLSLTFQKVSSKNYLRFQVKLSAGNSYFRVNIYFNELQLPIKIYKESN